SNGSGKSSLLRIMAGIDKDFNGEAWAAEGTRIGYLAQEPSVFRKLTVEENIIAVWQFKGDVPKKEQKGRLEELLEEFNLTKVAKNKGSQLSGGERRRVEIARAMAANPSFLLLDEPFSAIDPLTVAELQKMIRKLKEKNLGILITDHNVRETLGVVDYAHILSSGEVVVSGSPEEIAQSEIARKHYLGEEFRM
ncbi:MAG: ABC transporter ATP-binding protein, partial [Candidatus Sericytochromatia bacterium]